MHIMKTCQFDILIWQVHTRQDTLPFSVMQIWHEPMKSNTILERKRLPAHLWLTEAQFWFLCPCLSRNVFQNVRADLWPVYWYFLYCNFAFILLQLLGNRKQWYYFFQEVFAVNVIWRSIGEAQNNQPTLAYIAALSHSAIRFLKILYTL